MEAADSEGSGERGLRSCEAVAGLLEMEAPELWRLGELPMQDVSAGGHMTKRIDKNRQLHD
jgi:hypothetical protein